MQPALKNRFQRIQYEFHVWDDPDNPVRYAAVLIQKGSEQYAVYQAEEGVVFFTTVRELRAGVYVDAELLDMHCQLAQIEQGKDAPTLEEIADKLTAMSALDLIAQCFDRHGEGFELERVL